MLHYTGCRISEALALTARRVDLDNQVLVFETLKKRRTSVFREVPVPASLIDTLIYANALGGEQRSIAERMWK